MVFCDGCAIGTVVYAVGLFTILSKLLPIAMEFLNKGKVSELVVKEYKKDVVYLVQFPGSKTYSSASPYCVKVEAFMRINNIPFERVYAWFARGRNGKLPMIELNGEQICDSQLIVRRLAEKFKVKNTLDPKTAGLVHAIDRFVDLQTFNLQVYYKSQCFDVILAECLPQNFPLFLVPIFTKFMGILIARTYLKAFGVFSDAEFNELIRSDYTHLLNILGNQKYLFGEKPTLADCTAFGHLGAFYFAVPHDRIYPCSVLNEESFKPLREWLDRMKTEVFQGEFHKSEKQR